MDLMPDFTTFGSVALLQVKTVRQVNFRRISTVDLGIIAAAG
jgi:hypothetical protein